MSGYVVCRACGTRIKAGREFCLHCFEPLPDPDLPVTRPLYESLGLSRNTEIGIGIGALVAVLALAVLIWQTDPAVSNEEAQPMAPAGTYVRPQPPASDKSAAADSLAPSAAAEGPSAPAPAADPDPDLEATRADYETRLASRPNDADLQVRLGQVLQRMGRGAEAATHYERAISIVPRNAAYRMSLGNVTGELGQWDVAINQYREAASLLPGDYAAQYGLAMALQKKGDDQTAVPAFQKARKIAPTESGASLGLAVSLEKTGRVDESVQEYTRFLEMRPPGPDAERVRAHLALLSHGRSQVK